MKKYQVLKKIGTWDATVEREFDEEDDARLFMALLQKGETNKSVKLYVSKIISVQSEE